MADCRQRIAQSDGTATESHRKDVGGYSVSGRMLLGLFDGFEEIAKADSEGLKETVVVCRMPFVLRFG